MIYLSENLTLDTNLYSLTINNDQIDIEPQVFDLLVYLIENRNRVVARNELLDKLWKGRIVTDSALNARLKAARRAVGDSGRRQNIIKTIHGRGYQFIADVAESKMNEASETVSRPPKSLSSSEAPSIAVLPFENMSGDPAQEYFSDGITEDIITELSRFRELAVMARNSSFFYKGQATKVQDIGHELGVDYVVEGSVRKSGNRVRVTVQMVEADTGNHIWAERYDRELGDIFAVQDELARAIVSVLPTRLQNAVVASAYRKPTPNLNAYDYYLRGRWVFFQAGSEDHTAVEFLEKAIELDPRFALAYAILANVYAYRLYSLTPWDGNPEAQAKLYIEQALGFAENDPVIHVCAADIYIACAEFDLAKLHIDLAITLNPNDIYTIHGYGFVLAYLGNAAEGLRWIQEARRMEVHVPGLILETLAEVQYLLHDYEAAIETFKRWREPPLHTYAHLAACYAQLGRADDAQRTVNEYNRRRSDGSNFPRYAAQHARICKRQEDADHWLDGYRKAGLLD